MIDEIKLKNLKNVLKKHNQSQLLAFWDSLDTARRQCLFDQLVSLNFDQLSRWRDEYVLKDSPFKLPANLAPSPSYAPQPQNDNEITKYEQAKKLGIKLISQGKVAAFIVAGGQGTRLGYDGPREITQSAPSKIKPSFEYSPKPSLLRPKNITPPAPGM
jgi:UDP-N-acetylglucosamine/UDP-N-acetylgalactosamine diphosphorylase